MNPTTSTELDRSEPGGTMTLEPASVLPGNSPTENWRAYPPGCLPADTARALMERQQVSTAVPMTMPPSFYSDATLYPLERERVFINGWVCVGRADEIPQVGDFYTLDILDEPLIVVRQTDGEVAVLSNVCRHRGSQILTGAGHTARFTCPYHRWSYALDGELVAAPLMDEARGFNAAQCRLPSFRATNWMGWIFVNLDGKASDFHVEVAGLDDYVRNYHTEEMRTIGVETEYWDVNWKCLAENFMEGYHLTPVHRTTLHPMTPTRLCEKIPCGKGYTGYRSHYSPSFQGRTQVHPDMTPEECRQSMMVWIYPGFVAAISPNSSVYMSITPSGPASLQTRWGVVARSEVADSAEAEERMAFARAFNSEDRERLLDVQKGLRSRFATRGFLAPPDYEGTVWDFYGFIANKML